MVEGFKNGASSLDLTEIGRYDSNMTNADGGVMEIVDYNETTGYAYAINGQTGRLSVSSLQDLQAGEMCIRDRGRRPHQPLYRRSLY